MNKQYHLELAESAAVRAGRLLLGAYISNPGVVSESDKDIKTEADIAAEKVLLDALRVTDFSILSEESGLLNKHDAHVVDSHSALATWIIDPLDGTFNFTRGFPMCCVSIGLWSGNEPILGVIYDFLTSKIYSGIVGEGANCNGIPIRVSTVDNLSQAALATGFPSSRDYSDTALVETLRNVQKFKKIRMLGSAASSLAHLASGHVDAYLEEDIWIWDVAAGLAIVKAAGGIFSISEIKDSWQLDVFASNGLL